MITRRNIMLGASAAGVLGMRSAWANLPQTVFVGNCQIAAMYKLYCDTLEPSEQQKTRYIASYISASEKDRIAIESADRVILQHAQMEQKIGSISTHAAVYLVPIVGAQFLWPLSGEAHPANTPESFLPSGPYPPEWGNVILSKMYREGRTSEADAASYLATDVAKQKRVQRAYDIILEQQMSRDKAAGGYKIAEIISSRFRIEPLFRSRGHLNATLTRHLADVLFNKIGLPEAKMEMIRSAEYDNLFPITEDAIHPSIAETFGLQYVTPKTTYEFWYEGRFTALESAVRYLHYSWCPELAHAVYLMSKHEFDRALPLLQMSVGACPRSHIAKRMLATAEQKVRANG